MDLRHTIASRDFSLAVVGTGRVGLPLLAAYAAAGVRRVVGIDTNESLRAQLVAGTVPFREQGLPELWKTLDRKRIAVCGQIPGAIEDSAVIVVAVGTPLTPALRPDMSQVRGVVREILACAQEGSLLILRSTLAPGSTNNILLPLIRDLGRDDIHLAIAPERIAEGYALAELRELPEIVGTTEPYTADCVEAFFRLLNPAKSVLRTDPATAEAAKVVANVYRYLNFAFSNDFAMMAEVLGVDAREAIRIANEGYKRGGIPMPGPSGGPCLQKDGHFLPPNTPYAEFVKTAWHINESVPLYAVSKIKAELGSLYRAPVGVLGTAFKAESDDTRDSPALRLIEALQGEGAEVLAHDPYVPGTQPLSRLAQCSAVVLACNHRVFSNLGPDDFPAAKVFYDMWGMLTPKRLAFENRGVRFLAFGRGE